MAKAPLDSDIRRLPVTLSVLGGFAISFGAIFSAIIWVQSWVDDRISAGVRSYSYELIFPRVERLESSNKRIMTMLETQESDRNSQHAETKYILNKLLERQ